MDSHVFRILLYAHVDLNVIDGSAFFVAGAASLLTSAPGVKVDVIAATPIRRPVVVHEMLVNDRVTVIDPFRDQRLATRLPAFRGATRMDEQTAATVLDQYLDLGKYDVVIVRSTEVADALATLRPNLGGRMCVYVTGVVSADVAVDEGLRRRLQRLVDGGVTLLCQTPEMRDHLLRNLALDGVRGGLALMSPAVPAETDAVPPRGRGPLVLAYTGKFAPAWNSVELLAGFKEAASSGADLQLVVAGDHFKRPPEWPTFGAEVRYLLGSHPAISWVGAIKREDARALMSGADVGLGWRHSSLDSSLELSTKLLEHGALGRPCVINPTAMHVRLFGDDYPLFASSTTGYVDLLRRMATDRGLVTAAAEIAMGVAAEYTYERVFREVFPTLVDAASRRDTNPSSDLTESVRVLLRSTNRIVEHEGWLVSWLASAEDAAGILTHSGARGTVHAVERLGPFIRWPADGGATLHGIPMLELLVETLAAGRGTSATDASTAVAEPTIASDVAGRLRLAAPAPRADATEIGAGVARLTSDLLRQEKATERLTTRYKALSGSRLGRLQLAYWRALARLRGHRPAGAS